MINAALQHIWGRADVRNPGVDHGVYGGSLRREARPGQDWRSGRTFAPLVDQVATDKTFRICS